MSGARRDECGQEQTQTQTKHEWDDMNDGDDRGDRPQMADDDANDSQANRSQIRINPDMLRDGQTINQCATWSVSRGSEDTSLGCRDQSAGSVGSRVAN